jgi:hypothetical protein
LCVLVVRGSWVDGEVRKFGVGRKRVVRWSWGRVKGVMGREWVWVAVVRWF